MRITDLNEDKIPASVLDSLDYHFSSARGKFPSASAKFVAVRDRRAAMTRDKETQRHMKSVTPGTFFRYKKGNRDMVKPEEPVVHQSPTLAVVPPTKKSDEIPFTPSTTGEFEALPTDTFEEYSIPSVMSYYMNTYYNTMAIHDLAKKIAWAHFSFDDDTTSDDVVKMLQRSSMSPSVKRRLPDDQIVEKSIEHFGLSDTEVSGAANGEFKSIVDAYHDKVHAVQYPGVALGNTNAAKYFRDKRKKVAYSQLKDALSSDLVSAYIKRDAQSLKKAIHSLQVLDHIHK